MLLQKVDEKLMSNYCNQEVKKGKVVGQLVKDIRIRLLGSSYISEWICQSVFCE